MGSSIGTTTALHDALISGMLQDASVKEFILPAITNIDGGNGDFGQWYETFQRIKDACEISIMKALTVEQKRLLRGIAGPHGKAILRALEVKKQ